MAKKAANKSSKPMTKKGMKKTKGGVLIGLSKPAIGVDSGITGNLLNGNISGNTISGNTVNGDNKLNGGTLTNNTWTG
jgi:hypothetical protein